MAATSTGHTKFAPRTYTSSLSNVPDRAGFGGSSNGHQTREAQRLERERERAERDRLEREGPNQLAELSEEQREEINEAVSFPIYSSLSYILIFLGSTTVH